MPRVGVTQVRQVYDLMNPDDLMATLARKTQNFLPVVGTKCLVHNVNNHVKPTDEWL